MVPASSAVPVRSLSLLAGEADKRDVMERVFHRNGCNFWRQGKGSSYTLGAYVSRIRACCAE